MSDKEKAEKIMEATNQGADLGKPHQLIVQSALKGELGQATRLIFYDLWMQHYGEKGGPAGANQ